MSVGELVCHFNRSIVIFCRFGAINPEYLSSGPGLSGLGKANGSGLKTLALDIWHGQSAERCWRTRLWSIGACQLRRRLPSCPRKYAPQLVEKVVFCSFRERHYYEPQEGVVHQKFTVVKRKCPNRMIWRILLGR